MSHDFIVREGRRRGFERVRNSYVSTDTDSLPRAGCVHSKFSWNFLEGKFQLCLSNHVIQPTHTSYLPVSHICCSYRKNKPQVDCKPLHFKQEFYSIHPWRVKRALIWFPTVPKIEKKSKDYLSRLSYFWGPSFPPWDSTRSYSMMMYLRWWKWFCRWLGHAAEQNVYLINHLILLSIYARAT